MGTNALECYASLSCYHQRAAAAAASLLLEVGSGATSSMPTSAAVSLPRMHVFVLDLVIPAMLFYETSQLTLFHNSSCFQRSSMICGY